MRKDVRQILKIHNILTDEHSLNIEIFPIRCSLVLCIFWKKTIVTSLITALCNLEIRNFEFLKQDCSLIVHCFWMKTFWYFVENLSTCPNVEFCSYICLVPEILKNDVFMVFWGTNYSITCTYVWISKEVSMLGHVDELCGSIFEVNTWI